MFAQHTVIKWFCLHHRINQPVEWVSAVMSSVWKQEEKQTSLALIKIVLYQRVNGNRTSQCSEKTLNQTLCYWKHLFRKKEYTIATPKVFQCV